MPEVVAGQGFRNGSICCARWESHLREHGWVVRGKTGVPGQTGRLRRKTGRNGVRHSIPLADAWNQVLIAIRTGNGRDKAPIPPAGSVIGGISVATSKSEVIISIVKGEVSMGLRKFIIIGYLRIAAAIGVAVCFASSGELRGQNLNLNGRGDPRHGEDPRRSRPPVAQPAEHGGDGRWAMACQASPAAGPPPPVLGMRMPRRPHWGGWFVGVLP